MPDQHQQPHLRHHLLIAGTGRAGTSFLVRWLAAAGLRTHLSAHDTPMWDDDANAGLEDLPVVTDWQAAPYVMKSPWLVEVIDDVLADPRIKLDGVIIPVRDLTEAASSRVVQELHAAHRKNPWMAGLGRAFEQWGTTPGGVVYSLDPVDQARLLAVSFHRLVQRLVQADIPIVLLDFPRLALDADYLFGKLRRFVPATVAQARAAHAQLADPEKIRVGRELAAARESNAPEPACGAPDRLDAVALRREVQRLLAELAEAGRAAAAHQGEAAELRSALDMEATKLAGLAPIVEGEDQVRQASQAQVATLIATVAQRRAEAEHAAAAQQEAVAGLREALDSQAAKLADLVATLKARDADRQSTQAQIATLTAAAEQSRADAERAAAEQRVVVTDLRGTLDTQTAELAGLAAALQARDADLEAARAEVARLTAVAHQQGADAARAATAQQELVAGLRNTLDAQAAELAGLSATLEARDAALAERDVALAARDAALEARDAELAAEQAHVATLTAMAEQRRVAAERAATEQRELVAGLRSALDAQVAELAGLGATLAARDADLAAAQAHVATLTATAEQLRQERDRVLASWSWRAGQPLRLTGHAARAIITALRPARPPVA